MIKSGDKIGKLTVLEKDILTEWGQMWKCQCECGNLTSVREDNLENGRDGIKGGTRSCGCLNPVQNHCKGIKRVNRTGQIVNDYQYTIQLLADSNRSYKWLAYDIINEMWKIIAPRNVKELKHSKWGEFKTAKECLENYYKKIAQNKFSRFKDENNIMMMLYENHFLWTKQYSFEDCKDQNPLPFDIAVFYDDGEDVYLNYLIEFDGLQHFVDNGHFDYKTQHKHDLIKNKYCFDNNVPLIRIPAGIEYTLKDMYLETTRFLLTPSNEIEYYESRV